MTLLVMIALLWLMWAITDHYCPLATHLIRRLGRFTHRLIWSRPVRNYGLLLTMAIWFVVMAAIFTVMALVSLNSNPGPTLFSVVILWVIVWLWWRFIRWRARRRYAPRRLPRRERRERQWRT